MAFWDSWFSTQKTVSVSSSVWNLAGDQNKRPKFLATTVLGSVISKNGNSIAFDINNNYRLGPGIRLKRFAKWARMTGYTSAVGQGQTNVFLAKNIDSSVLIPLLPPAPSGQTLILETASVGYGNYAFWVDEYLVANYPSQLGTDYVTEFDRLTNTVTITFVDTTTATFTIPDFDSSAFYLYVKYIYETPSVPYQPAVPASPGPPPTPYIPEVPYSPASWSDAMFIHYKQGSGNTDFDAFFSDMVEQGAFFPYVPIVINQYLVSGFFLPWIYDLNKKAVKKALNTNYDQLVYKILTNPSVLSVDYIYAVFGVSLNVKEQACRRYIYEFFIDIMAGQDLTSTSYHDWKVAWDAANASIVARKAWDEAQTDPSDPLYGTPAPTVLPLPPSPDYSVIVTSSNAAMVNYFQQIVWGGLTETTGTGVLLDNDGNPAKPGALWFKVIYNNPAITYVWLGGNKFVPVLIYNSQIRLNWQVDANTWRYLDIWDLKHINLIYGGGVGVITYAGNALSESGESGFIIPLNEGIYNRTPLAAATQMSTACCFLVFNSVTVKTAPWYTAGFFKVLMIVAAIVITIATAGTGTFGLLGADIALGSMLGLSGTAAIIAGSVINTLAAIVVVQIIDWGATKIFGPKLGMLIGAIVSMFTLQIGTMLANDISMTTIFQKILEPQNLLKFTEAASNFYAQIMQSEAVKINNSTQETVNEYNKLEAQLQKNIDELFGTGGADVSINPLALTDVNLPNQRQNVVFAESPGTFLTRTLLTGSEISDLSLSYVTNFCDTTLTTMLPVNQA